jgi:hypothetical protein
MHPAVPGRSDGRGFGQTLVDHPPPFEAERRVDSAGFGPVIAIAVFVLAHELAESTGPQLRAKGLAVPPGERTA